MYFLHRARSSFEFASPSGAKKATALPAPIEGSEESQNTHFREIGGGREGGVRRPLKDENSPITVLATVDNVNDIELIDGSLRENVGHRSSFWAVHFERQWLDGIPPSDNQTCTSGFHPFFFLHRGTATLFLADSQWRA